MRRTRFLEALLLTLATVAPGAWAQQTTAQPPDAPSGPDTTFESQIDVVESRVLIALPSLSKTTIGELQPDDLVVSEDGIRRKVRRLTPASGDSWTVEVYFDEVLARPFTLPTAAHALADRAAALTALGPVQVTWAGRYPDSLRQEQAPSSRTVEVEATLSRLARRADNALAQRLAAEPTERSQREITAQVLRERTDLLLADVAEQCDGGPCALLLVVDGYFLTEEPELSQITSTTEKLLAGLGWTVIALPMRPDEETLDPAQREEYRSGVGTDYDAWKEGTGGVLIRGRKDRKGRFDAVSNDTLDAYTLPEWEPLRDWSRATAGGIAASEDEMVEELQRLRGRWWLVFESQRAPHGALRPLVVRVAEASRFANRRALSQTLGLIPENTTLYAPDWARSGVPSELSDARWRRYSIRRTPPSGGLELALDRSEGDDASAVLASMLTWPTEQDRVRARLTFQRRDDVVESREVEIDPSDGTASLPLEPGERGLLLVHDLATGEWGAIRTDGL